MSTAAQIDESIDECQWCDNMATKACVLCGDDICADHSVANQFCPLCLSEDDDLRCGKD